MPCRRCAAFVLSLLVGFVFPALSGNVALAQSSDRTEPSDSAITATPSVLRTPHQDHHEQFGSSIPREESEWDSLHGIVHEPIAPQDIHRKDAPVVFGWHPYYMGSAYVCYNFNLLWGISYFSYEVDPETGSYKEIHDWKTTPMIDAAHEAGTKVFLTATNFGHDANRRFLGSREAQSRFIDSMAALLNERNAAGVNIDFESLPATERHRYSSFIADLSARMRSFSPAKLVTITLPGIIVDTAFDIRALSESVDLFMIMGYDYFYSGSPIAGPVSPLASGDIWGAYNLEASVKAYLKEGLPREQLILALPYYGREWKTRTESIPSKSLGPVGSRQYRAIRSSVDMDDAKLEPTGDSRYLLTTDDRRHAQLWFDDAESLGRKYDWVLRQGLAGVGLWALGYDNGTNDLWNVLGEKFGEKEEPQSE